MGIQTRLCKDIGMKVPVLLSGMGPFSTYKTALKVSNAGGCGLTSHWGILTPVDPETHYIDREHGKVLTPGEKMKFDLKYFDENIEDDSVFGCNIRVARIQTDAPRVIRQVLKKRLESRKIRDSLKVLVTSAGNPMIAQKLLAKEKYFPDGKRDILHFHVSPSMSLCQNTIKAGCDGVIAVGIEGGGHQSYEEVATSVLIPEVKEWLENNHPEKYLIAGGGFYNGRTLASGLSLGAEAVQMGTRFIASTDGDFHQNYKDAIVAAADDMTMMCSGAFGPIRLYKNKYALSHSKILSKEEKLKQESEIGTKDDMTQRLMDDMKRYDLVYEGDVENGAVLVGQTVGGINSLKSVAEIVADIEKEAIATIKRLNSII